MMKKVLSDKACNYEWFKLFLLAGLCDCHILIDDYKYVSIEKRNTVKMQ